ncbi:MAG: benE [Cypionkella sp.]|uniref:benzoate/H(+) symporter BenE family transporter n=1 Tax=Cypionkella sp. TaxID=2811411 RepID=UPI002626080A|nr:benzoate/H(+) symporter BenE family transporter [Cypionkella sp.]MDB5660027.1 benE [Cypionkella sp.]
MRIPMISAALVAVLVGYGSTLALVLSAAAALGATPAQTASWIFAIAAAKAVGSAFLSFRYRIPVVLAWSTPGAALLAATTNVTLPEAVGAFLVAAALIALTGAFRPLGRLIARIPDGIAAAMLAGVLLPFCLKASLAAQSLPALVLPMIAMFLAVRLKNPALAVLAALATGLVLAFVTGAAQLPPLTLPLPTLIFIPPAFRLDVLLGIGIPLYLVTMASQNLPGFATLRAAGYEPPVAPALITTGALSAIAGLFGAHTVNMAAITASICLAEDTHPDRSQRWKTGVIYGGFWMVIALLSPVILPILAALPPALMMALVALALLAPLMGALTAAFTPPHSRFAATVTLTTAASGVAAFGIGAAFWGLLAGLAVYALEHLRTPST